MASESKHVVKVSAEWDNAVMARPGDTLVVGLSVEITHTEQSLERLRSDCQEMIPGVKVVIIEGATAFAVIRADAM